MRGICALFAGVVFDCPYLFCWAYYVYDYYFHIINTNDCHFNVSSLFLAQLNIFRID